MLEVADFEEIMNKDYVSSWTGDNTFKGLLIIAKYISIEKQLIQGAEHDIIYSVDVDELVNAGITEEDIIELRKLNWIIKEDCLACFV